MIQQYDPSLAAHVVQDGTYYCGVWPYRAVEPPPKPQDALGRDWMPRAVQSKARGENLSERILGGLAGGPRTRTELCHALKLSVTTMCRILTPLIDEGRVVVDVLPPRQGTRGRNQYSYRLPSREDL